MTKQMILVVDDDPKIRALLRNALEDDGFVVSEAQAASDVMHLVASTPINLITLDIHLGADNGVELARQIRQVSAVPIIMVTGKNDVIDRVVGLEVGADDYITKPFHLREVLARIRSVLRRYDGAPMHSQEAVQGEEGDSARLLFDGLTAMPDHLTLIARDGAEIGLTSGDFKLLNVFLGRPKRVLSRDQLMDFTGGTEWSPLDRTIDNQIARLRKKIERDPSDPKLIKTVRGVGYVLACDVRAFAASDTPAKSA